MSEMIERVARAICRAEEGKTTGPGRHKAADEGYSPFPEQRWTKYEDDNWRRYIVHAGMAIATMKVPTVEMIVRGTEDWLCIRAMEDRAETIWDSMIDEAIGDGTV